MGCFTNFPCFTSSKHPKLNKSINPTTSSSYANQGYVNSCEIVLITVPTEESTKSRVDSEDWVVNKDVEVNKELFSVKSEDGKEKNVEGSGKLGVLVQRESAKERDDEKKIGNGILGVLVQIETENERKEAKQYTLGVHVDIENESEDESYEHKKEFRSGAVSDCSVSSYISYPPMHRYDNCVTDEDEEYVLIQEDSPESLFSLSIDPTRHSKSSPVKNDEKEVNSPLKTSSSPELIENNYNQSVDSLLNPIENLAQRKTTKVKPMLGLDHLQEKENLYIEQEEISKVSDRKWKVKTDTVVTTSLSSWLVDPEKSTVSKEESQYSGDSDGATSWKSCEDRPILGAWSIDEVKPRSSSRKSPCHNPDDTPIIGTVGSYWSHTGQTTDSSNSCTSPLGMSAKSTRNRKNKALSCHSSSKRRLERALTRVLIS